MLSFPRLCRFFHVAQDAHSARRQSACVQNHGGEAPTYHVWCSIRTGVAPPPPAPQAHYQYTTGRRQSILYFGGAGHFPGASLLCGDTRAVLAKTRVPQGNDSLHHRQTLTPRAGRKPRLVQGSQGDDAPSGHEDMSVHIPEHIIRLACITVRADAMRKPYVYHSSCCLGFGPVTPVGWL